MGEAKRRQGLPTLRERLEIRCARCNKPVDLVETWRDDYKSCFGVRVQCHGQEEARLVDDSFLAEGPITDAVAFDRPALAKDGGET